MKKIIIVVVLLCAGLTAYAQTRPRLGILPFTGGSGRDGDTIATLFSVSRELMNVFRIVPRTSSVEAVMREQEFQRSGITDSDTIAELGRQMNADYVVSGHIARLGNANLLLISIVDVNTMRQVTGDYREYQTIEGIPALLPVMAQNIIASIQDVNAASADTLAVLPLLINDPAIRQDEAELLAQILATEIANSRRFAVFPRTRVIETAMAEVDIQRSGMTDRESMAAIGKATNARYVLAGSISNLGRMNLFNIAILEIESAEQIAASYKQYRNLEDGIEIMGELSYEVTGVPAGRFLENVQIAEAEQQRLEAEQQRTAAERQRLEAQRQQEEAARQAERQRLEAQRQQEEAARQAEQERQAAERRRAEQQASWNRAFHNYLWRDGKSFAGIGGNLGISIGAGSLFFANVAVDIPIFSHLFIEGGIDFGLAGSPKKEITRKDDTSRSGYQSWDVAGYRSLYPYARVNVFLPVIIEDPHVSFYAGLGIGSMTETYEIEGETESYTPPYYDGYYYHSGRYETSTETAEEKYRLSGIDIVLGGFVGSEHHLFRYGLTFNFLTPKDKDRYPYFDSYSDYIFDKKKNLFAFQATLGYTYRFN
jgi:TolB-like protein